MQLTIELPSREEQLALNRQRWEALCADERYAAMPEQFETNGFGHIIMSPPPAFRHARYCAFISRTLDQQLPSGESLENVPISTADGVRAPDVVWGSSRYMEEETDDLLLESAPEICVEVASPSNSVHELEHKKSLYFDAGAKEVWTCSIDGVMQFFQCSEPKNPLTSSILAPDFPNQITL